MTAKITREITIEDLPEIVLQDVPTIDDTAAGAAALREKLNDALTPGYQAEFDPEEAERAGAFREDALNELDAAGSTDDLAAALEEPAFLDDEGPSAGRIGITAGDAGGGSSDGSSRGGSASTIGSAARSDAWATTATVRIDCSWPPS